MNWAKSFASPTRLRSCRSGAKSSAQTCWSPPRLKASPKPQRGGPSIAQGTCPADAKLWRKAAEAAALGKSHVTKYLFPFRFGSPQASQNGREKEEIIL